MAGYVIMPKDDWVRILNRVRGKTKSNRAMVSGEVDDEVGRIPVFLAAEVNEDGQLIVETDGDITANINENGQLEVTV